jgi:simple sugar transport system substrate-binding protein
MSAIARAALDEGVNGLAIDIFDAAAFAPVVAEARARGVPVVAFNINEGGGKAGNLSGIAQDFLAAGKVLGRQAAAAIKPGSTALITMHDPGISALEARRDGIKAALADLDIHWVEAVTGHHPDAAARHILDVLDQRPDISALLATGQADTEGAGLAVEQSGRGLFAAGFDLSSGILRLIEAGHLAMTIDQQPYAQGFYPVVQLALNLRYGLLPVDMDAGAAVIDRSNAASVGALAQAGYR